MTELEPTQTLKAFFTEVINIPDDAQEWLIGLWNATQFLDDVADGDTVSRPQIDAAINELLIGMPSNDFYRKYMIQLLPVVGTFVCKWQASDFLERRGMADERSFMWRAGYYDVILIVTILCHGMHVATKMAPDILSLYGETYKSYKEEFADG